MPVGKKQEPSSSSSAIVDDNAETRANAKQRGRKDIPRSKTVKRKAFKKSIPRSHKQQQQQQSVASPPPVLVVPGGRELRHNSERQRLRCESKLVEGEAVSASMTLTHKSPNTGVRSDVGGKTAIVKKSTRPPIEKKLSIDDDPEQSSSDVDRLREVKNNSVKRGEQFRIYLSLRRIAIRSRRSRNIVGTYCRR